jgi:hypothetical protein
MNSKSSKKKIALHRDAAYRPASSPAEEQPPGTLTKSGSDMTETPAETVQAGKLASDLLTGRHNFHKMPPDHRHLQPQTTFRGPAVARQVEK